MWREDNWRWGGGEREVLATTWHGSVVEKIAGLKIDRANRRDVSWRFKDDEARMVRDIRPQTVSTRDRWSITNGVYDFNYWQTDCHRPSPSRMRLFTFIRMPRFI